MPGPMHRKTHVSPYITPEGQRHLREELSYLWKDKRPRVTRAVAEAAAMGDRSENAEYIYGKKQLREIDSRIRFLQKRLNEVMVVDRIPDDRSKVFFGAWVEVQDADGTSYRYRIVGPDEIDPGRKCISIDSPMARALLGKAQGDTIVVSRPDGRASFLLTSISYDCFGKDQEPISNKKG